MDRPPWEDDSSLDDADPVEIAYTHAPRDTPFATLHSAPAVTTALIGDIVAYDRAHGKPPDPLVWWSEEETALDQVQDPEGFYDLLLQAERHKRAAQMLINQCEAVLLGNVLAEGEVRFGEEVLGHKPAGDRSLADPYLFLRWVADGAVTVDAVVDRVHKVIRVEAKSVRITEVDALAQARGDDPKAARDTLFLPPPEDPETGKRLRTLNRMNVNLDRTPQWARKMERGERRPRK
jgi:hypothetical protein